MILAALFAMALLVGVGLAISGQLGRIATAIEAQNEHYGIGDEAEEPEPVQGANRRCARSTPHASHVWTNNFAHGLFTCPGVDPA